MSEAKQESRERWGAAATAWETHGEALRRATMPVSLVDGRRDRSPSPATRCSSWRPARATRASSPPS